MRAIPLRLPAAALLMAVAVLPGCHRKVEDPAALTGDEQAQLNDAAAMLDANAIDAGGNDGDDTADDNTEDRS